MQSFIQKRLYMNKEIRPKTLSRFFYNDEIISKGSDGTLYLKQGVRRKYYIMEETEETAPLINTDLTRLEKLKSFEDVELDDDSY